MKIGVLTYHRAINYGAFLQAYALCQKLDLEPGIDAELIDFQMNKEVSHYNIGLSRLTLRHPIIWFHNKVNEGKQKQLFEIAMQRQKLSSERVISDSIEDFISAFRGKYDAIIVGSDEVWKTDGFRGFPTPYWLFGDLGCAKLSYAVSARTQFNILPMHQQEMLANALKDFDYIGVRDVLTQQEVKKYCSKAQTVHLCCDPTFLIDFNPNKENGLKILKERFGVDVEKQIIGIMTEKRIISKRIKTLMKTSKFEIISLYEFLPGCINASLLSPFEWIDVVACLSLIITSYFHAVCFATKLGVPLIAFGTANKATKVEEVLVRINRENNYYSNIEDLVSTGKIKEIIEYKVDTDPAVFIPDENLLDGYYGLVKCLRERFILNYS